MELGIKLMKLLVLFGLFILVGCESEPQRFIAGLQPQKEVLTTKRSTVKWGQGLFQALQNVEIDSPMALKLINALRDEVEFSKLQVGDKVEGTFNQEGDLVRFTFSQNPAERHIVSLNPETEKWDYSFEEEKTIWNARILEGELREGSTLQDDLLAEGLARPVVASVVNVLLCKVNFRMNARMGDQYRVLLSERKYNGRVIGTKVLYTSYKGYRAGFHEAYFYEDAEKNSTYTAHYTEKGQALIRSGLRYPLDRLHVRSGYGMRRHPVTGKRKMHRGVDLRARAGKKVYSVARGRVVESTYNKFSGNKVAIRHSDGSTSYYLHLKTRRVNKGDHVISHQVIGTVGSTGRVTGPHLHFGFKKPNGRWMNPLNKRMIATPKLKGERLAQLKQQIAKTKGLLLDLQISQVSNYVVARIPNKKDPFFFNL
jgi:murein DD-endopeptidase MepM/ murein hydrolase activator NlpD